MKEKFGEGCIEERVCSSLSIRAGVVITAVGMGREVESRCEWPAENPAKEKWSDSAHA